MGSTAPNETWRRLYDEVRSIPAVDAHTHIQDDLDPFTPETAAGNLAGTQAAFNRPSAAVVEQGLAAGRLARRTMSDPTHALFYSWFAEVAEGAGNRLDAAVARLGANSVAERREAGRLLLRELRDARYSEYAEWLRSMFRLYPGLPEGRDPLDPGAFDAVWEAVSARRADPAFARGILQEHRIRAYVTSIENRDRLPTASPPRPAEVDLSYATHPEAWSMFDFNGLLWPERATDFGLFTQGHKFQAERYLLHLEEYLGRPIGNAAELREGVRGFIRSILRSPRSNPTSRVLYVDGFQAEEFRFSRPWSVSSVAYAIRHHKPQLDGDLRRQVIGCVADAMLEAMEEIGREYAEAGERLGCCLQLCGGATHFMDWAREIQSFPAPIPRLAQEEYATWLRFPHVHFEYLCAHEALYADLAGAAKQVGNVSVGPWWHLFRRRSIARMLREQLSMGPISSIACGFTDARFLEMLAAKYRSLRLAVTDALAELVEDEGSAMYRDLDAAREVAAEILYRNPLAVHHIPPEAP